MPTFDFANIVRGIVRSALLLLSNPITVMVIVGGAIATAVGVYVGVFSSLQIPEIQIGEWDTTWISDDWASFFTYFFDLETPISIINFAIKTVYVLIPAFLSFVVSVFGAYWVFVAYKSVHRLIKDIGG